MKSHLYAQKLKEAAKFILSRPEFETAGQPMVYFSYYQKENFLAAVKALGAGTKKFTDHDVQFTPKGFPEDIFGVLTIPRNKLCTLVKPAVYDCESFLSPEEIETF